MPDGPAVSVNTECQDALLNNPISFSDCNFLSGSQSIHFIRRIKILLIMARDGDEYKNGSAFSMKIVDLLNIR